MKKIIGLLLVVVFAAGLASVAFGRTLEEEKTAVREYLSVVDAKIINAREAGDTSKVKVLQNEKAGTLRRWEKLQAEMTAPVAPVPVAPVPTPAPVVAKTTPTGLLGMGLNTCTSVGYISGKSLLTIREDIVLDDGMGLASIVGLSASALKWRLGLGYASGNDQSNLAMHAIPVFLDGVLDLPIGGVGSYIGGGVNYVVYGTGQTSGTYGGQLFAGIRGDLGLGGKTFLELGYGAIRAKNHSAKGMSVVVGQAIVL